MARPTHIENYLVQLEVVNGSDGQTLKTKFMQI